MPSTRRVLVDECVPRQLLASLTEHSARSVQQMGWAGITNGALLELAAREFDVIFTVDRAFAGLTDSVAYRIGVVILEARSTNFKALLPHMRAVKIAIDVVRAGEVRRVRVW